MAFNRDIKVPSLIARGVPGGDPRDVPGFAIPADPADPEELLPWLRRKRAEQRERREAIQVACEREGKTGNSSGSMINSLHVDLRRRVGYCSHAKVQLTRQG